MFEGREYIATLATIGVLCIAGALVCIFGNAHTEVDLARMIGALSFIGSGVTGLIGVIGTFRPKGPPSAITASGDINIPKNEGDVK